MNELDKEILLAQGYKYYKGEDIPINVRERDYRNQQVWYKNDNDYKCSLCGTPSPSTNIEQAMELLEGILTWQLRYEYEQFYCEIWDGGICGQADTAAAAISTAYLNWKGKDNEPAK